MAKKQPAGDSRKPHPIDTHVGRRIRMRRSIMGISQEKLAEAVGLTFQQIQKYERGMNRVSASRLYQFSNILSVPISFFYEEFSEDKIKAKPRTPVYGLSDTEQTGVMDDTLLYSKETLDLLKVYYSITNEDKRREVFKIFRSMVDSISSGD